MANNQQLAVYSTAKELKAFLETGKGSIANALPRHLNPDRMLRLALTAFSTTPALRECTGHSILGAIVVAAQIGLEPGVTGQGYLIPYGKNCTFVPGWQGLVGLLNNSGRATAWTGAVFDGDVWDFQLGSAPRCVHIPGPNFGDPTKMEWVYACGKVNGSEQPVIEAWPMSRVWRHRDKFNKVGARHYSFQHPEMYARKVVLLQVLKYMPRSIELNNAIVAADAAEIGHTSRAEGGVVIDVDPDSSTIASGNVGRQPDAKTITEAAQQEREEEKPQEPVAKPPVDPTPEPEKEQPKGPSVKSLVADLIEKARGINAGKGKLTSTLVSMKWIDENVELASLSAERLAEIIDGWEEVKDRILNPEA